jgi:hypothetical protein
MNTTKLFEIPSFGYLLETTQGNFLITNQFVSTTTETSEGLEEYPFDTAIQATIDNAKFYASKLLSENEVSLLTLLVNEKIEDFDGPEA